MFPSLSTPLILLFILSLFGVGIVSGDADRLEGGRGSEGSARIRVGGRQWGAVLDGNRPNEPVRRGEARIERVYHAGVQVEDVGASGREEMRSFGGDEDLKVLYPPVLDAESVLNTPSKRQRFRGSRPRPYIPLIPLGVGAGIGGGLGGGGFRQPRPETTVESTSTVSSSSTNGTSTMSLTAGVPVNTAVGSKASKVFLTSGMAWMGVIGWILREYI